ncbi:fungal-specific transcription factor domain-containing protein [Aspergillus carlsbadensis]|nr:fungal-specific transcription factor domain-containing protein [Aspergillus carlsbadensis]
MSPVNSGETMEARWHRLSSIPRAVRCDRSIPCANCRAAKIACRQPNERSSRHVQADRVANLQGLVERLESRLRDVESRLAAVEQPQPQPASVTAASTPQSSADDPGTKQLLSQLQTSIRASEVRRPIFLSSYAVTDLSIVESLCQKVYSTSELASPGEISSMHGVLYFIIKEMIAFKDPLSEKFDLPTYFENVLALVMGMIKSQGEARPYLYWKLVSTAVTHCQTLGYHRESTYRDMPPSEAESIRRLLWTVYAFDKNMSLVLGRASFAQCLDIDAQYPTVSTDPALRAWDESFIMGIRLAELQGRIFAGLYFTPTMIKDHTARQQLISDLARAMEDWHAELKQINPEGVNGPEVFSLSRGNWEILFYSTQTLLFHASSTSLRAHLDVFPRYQEAQLLSDGDYCNWILLSSSFVPFIVTFLHAIATKDPAKASLLQDVLSTLQTFRYTSRGSETLYQICATFTQVARKLVSSQQWLPTMGGIYTQQHQQRQQQDQYQKDKLRVSDIAQNPSSLFEPQFFQDALYAGAGHSDGNSTPAMTDSGTLDPAYTSDILNDWLNGPPFPWERLDGC